MQRRLRTAGPEIVFRLLESRIFPHFPFDPVSIALKRPFQNQLKRSRPKFGPVSQTAEVGVVRPFKFFRHQLQYQYSSNEYRNRKADESAPLS